MKLSIIIPVYNEEESLATTLNSFEKYLNKQPYDYEIIIVNDGSTDNSWGEALNLAARNYKIRVVCNKKNKGKGAVVRQGMLMASGDFALFVDADNATSIDHMGLVWPEIEKGNNIVIGSRSIFDVQNTKIIKAQSKWKVFLGKLGNFLIRKVAVADIWDTQCGFKVFDRRAINEVFTRARIDRWAFDVEILALAQKYGFKIAKIPVRWMNSEKSHVGLRGYFITLKELWLIRKNLRNNVY